MGILKGNRMARKKGLSFYNKRKKKISSSIVSEIINYLVIIFIAVFLASCACFFLGMRTNVVGNSMEPTLNNGQEILIDRFKYTLSKPKVGDVVVFLPNGNEKSHYYVKRVVAVPGDKVQVIGYKLYVNGEPSEYMKMRIIDAGIAENEILLELGEYFCIGDDPNNSEDSRSPNIGPVHDSDIIGKAWYKLSNKEIESGFIE